MGKWVFSILICVLLAAGTAAAKEGCGGGACINCHSLSLNQANDLLREVGEVKKIEPAPVKGLWLLELEKDGQQGVVFMDFAGKNLIAGTVFPLNQTGTPRESGQTAPAKRLEASVDVTSIPLDNSIIMGNRNGNKRMLVFTDPDCPFCIRLHGELKKLVAMDSELAVYVKLFPLKMHPGAYNKSRVILGARSLEVLDRAFTGASLPAPGPADAAKPVDETIRLAWSLGIESTPTLILPDGRVVVGFREAAVLKELMSGDSRK